MCCHLSLLTMASLLTSIGDTYRKYTTKPNMYSSGFVVFGIGMVSVWLFARYNSDKIINIEQDGAKKMDRNKTHNIFLIAAGFGRTGTSSLQVALNTLGFRTYHGRELMKNWHHNEYWIDAAKKKIKLKKEHKVGKDFQGWDKTTLSKNTIKWNDVFAFDQDTGYNACCDFPSCLFYLDLIEFYGPNHKIILTVRDSAESWYGSIAQTFAKGESIIFLPFIGKFLFKHLLGLSTDNLNYVGYQLLLDGNRWSDKELCIQKYNDWIESVKQNVPKDKLLVYNVKQGWEPLCKFLDIEIPNESFPHANERKVMRKAIDSISWTAYLMQFSAISAVCLGLYSYYKSRQKA